MISEEIQLHNPSGLHLRPAGLLVKAATRYRAEITITTADGMTVNAKSLLNILAACVKKDDTITLSCNGRDENEAMETLKNLINDGLGEL